MSTNSSVTTRLQEWLHALQSVDCLPTHRALQGACADLQVFHGVPVMLQEDDHVCSCQVEPQSTDMRGKQHHRYGRVGIEALHHAEARRSLNTATQTSGSSAVTGVCRAIGSMDRDCSTHGARTFNEESHQEASHRTASM